MHPIIRKAVAYITRERNGVRELLIFAHRDQPEAGLQVPAGTVEPGEEPARAVLREAEEETGMSGLTLVRHLGTFVYFAAERQQYHERHVYHLAAPPGLPDRWDHLAEGQYIFQFRWVPLTQVPKLAGGQGDYLHTLA